MRPRSWRPVNCPPENYSTAVDLRPPRKARPQLLVSRPRGRHGGWTLELQVPQDMRRHTQLSVAKSSLLKYSSLTSALENVSEGIVQTLQKDVDAHVTVRTARARALVQLAQPLLEWQEGVCVQRLKHPRHQRGQKHSLFACRRASTKHAKRRMQPHGVKE